MYVFIQGFLYEWFYILRRRLCFELHDYWCVCGGCVCGVCVCGVCMCVCVWCGCVWCEYVCVVWVCVVCFTLQHKLAHWHMVLLGSISVFAFHSHSTNAPYSFMRPSIGDAVYQSSLNNTLRT